MSSLQAGIDCLVLDGGVLIEWLRWRYIVLVRPWPETSFQPHFLRSDRDLSAWERLLKQYPGKIYMSAYAIAEVQRHVRDGERANRAQHRTTFRRACWRTVREVFREYPVNERHIQWTDLDEVLLHDYGPADASLIALARHLTRERKRPCIVTLDAPLRHRCTGADLDLLARDPHELLARAIR